MPESKETRVWSECGITLPAGEFASVRFRFGFERMIPANDATALKEAEAKIFRMCEKVVDARVRALRELIQEAQEDKPKTKKRKRSSDGYG